tara:strand:- start:17343 stop:17861 length:519 start_codon:yes stop_codon:yes gene_type:complete
MQQIHTRDKIAICCGVTSFLCTLSSISIGIIVWIVYAIIGLTEVSDKTIRNHCGSLLWRYVVTMIVIIFIQIKSHTNHNNEKTETENKINLCYILFSWLQCVAFGSWGTYEIWGRNCTNELSKYLIYKMAYIIVYFEWVYASIILICTIVMCISLVSIGSQKNKELTNIQTV